MNWAKTEGGTGRKFKKKFPSQCFRDNTYNTADMKRLGK
jgi:hypothetical protein